MSRVFIIGLGLFTLSIMDPLYNTYVPLFLRRYMESNFLVGGIMTLDNILQLLFIPIIAAWSDRTRTRMGRRLPFIAVMLPVAAILFNFIPTTAAASLAALVILLFFFNLFKTTVRGPVVALMPDTIPGEYRSEANGVISMMGGIGTIIGTIALTRLFDIGEGLPFTATTAITIIAVIVMLICIRERKPEEGEDAAETRYPLLKSLKQVFSAGKAAGDYSFPMLLLSLFFWFMAYEGIQPFLGLYLVQVVGVAESNAALAVGVAGVSSVALAIPSGYLGHRMGRRKLIRISLIFLGSILLLVPLSTSIAMAAGMPINGTLGIFLVLMFLYGTVWIAVMVNSFPMVWQMADYNSTGIYTGLYYTFSQAAAIVAPPVTGLIIDLGGYPGIFIFGGLCMYAAIFTMAKVKRGEPGQAPIGLGA
jgi:MFS family permease